MRYVKALGLCLLAALGVMAVGAGGASAGELKGDFLVNGKLLTANETGVGKPQNPGETSLLVPNLNFAISCHNFHIQSGVVLPLNVSGRSIGHGTLRFLECLAYTHQTLEALAKCTINEGDPIEGSALIHVVRDKSLGTAYLLGEPSGGLSAPFASITFGPLCGALAEEEIELRGSIVGEVGPEAVELSVKEASETVQLLFKDKLTFGTNQAFLDGTVLVRATGVNTGLPIGIEAGH